jgi:hypothetical protein
MEGPRPRRRTGFRPRRLLGLAAALAVCAAFWSVVVQAVIHVAG